MKKNRLLCLFANMMSGFFLYFLFCGYVANAIEIRDIQSPGGVHAWLVEDYTVPVVAVHFSFRGGFSRDPDGKEGLVNLMSGLFDEGAGDLSANAFQEKIDDLGGDIRFSATDDVIHGSLYVLAENRDKAVDLLALAVQRPRFDQEAIDRIREQIVVSIRASERDPSTIAQKKFASMVYRKHPYGRQSQGTVASLAKISRADLVAVHAGMFARDHVKIGITGPVSGQEAEEIVARIFDPLPQKSELQEVKQARLHLGGTTTVHYNMPQTSIVLLYPGVSGDDPDFFAACLMNYILGGPGLTSRLFVEVREKRGLAYNIGSRLTNRDYASTIVISTGTHSVQAQDSLKIIRAEIGRMMSRGITDDELARAKSYMIGSYAVQNMDSSSDIASTLVFLQEQGLPVDYIEKRALLINEVTLEKVNAVSRRVFGGEPAILVIGPVSD